VPSDDNDTEYPDLSSAASPSISPVVAEASFDRYVLLVLFHDLHSKCMMDGLTGPSYVRLNKLDSCFQN
ncbi:MAG: hypothetical protein ACPHM4_07835, partial [Candidatus Poseidoniaceae archaeon]